MPSLNSLLNRVFGSSNDRNLKKYNNRVTEINTLESIYENLSDEELRNKTIEFKELLTQGSSLDEILNDAFAVVREASKRTLGQRHFDVQIVGGLVLNEGKITEMKTGEGKTLVSTLPAYLNSLSGKGVHIVTVNDYLAKRDSEWMGVIYKFLGLDVGVIYSGQDDKEKEKAYSADITYGTNNEFGFDYLRDNMKHSIDQMFQKDKNFAIIDEVDSILIDEARTPLIISGVIEDKSDLYVKIDQIIPLINDEDIDIDEKSKSINLTEEGNERLDKILIDKGFLDNNSSIYDIENVALVHHINQALKAHKLFHKDTDYLVKDNQVIIIDEFTGRMMEGRRFSDGLHQALEAKENVHIQPENQTLASITFQNYFRLYEKLSGMTGTALTEAEEFMDIYGLGVVSVPTNVPIMREDSDDEIYRTEEEKYEAIIKNILKCNKRNQPVLVGTVSIEKSEILSKLLKSKNIKHNVLNARYHEQEAQIISQAGKPGSVTIATNMAGRGTDIQLGGNPENLENTEKNTEELKKIVIESGGLFVIGTERHESRRIDNQLRGRSGRQGDPGESKFYLSLEDDLMRIFGSDRLDTILQRLGLDEGEAIVHPWINTALERAQKKVESRNFDIRKNLLRFDDVMNDQRKVIFEQRLEILTQSDLSEIVKDMRHEILFDILDQSIPEKTFIDDWDADKLDKDIKRVFSIQLPIHKWFEEDGIDSDIIRDKLVQKIDIEYDNKSKEFGEDLLKNLEKTIILQSIDQNWKDHLGQLENLRQIVGLRGYGQRDPLSEYKSESFGLFEELLNNFREDVTRILFHIRMASDESLNKINQESIIDHKALKENVSPDSRMKKKNKTIRTRNNNEPINPNDPSTWGKVGRNSPCPCRSGKKYKNCHG
ncbi:MAG: preprotein translocase subunit SecA [Rhodobiaceae bacterium]|nr:preprotein translocase subunit SecA [Rhodobiaceae bacterium]|tara:strand:- start:850 stop:3504 length:2655 start_codon:yes stop_codon:yes gene_type:complete